MTKVSKIDRALALELRGVEIGWGELTVLPELDLELRHGEVLCVVGPGRSGKSTLLRVIEAMVHGRDPSAADPWWAGACAASVSSCARLRQHGEFHHERVEELFANADLLDRRERWLPRHPSAGAAVEEILDRPLSELSDPVRRFLSFTLVAYSGAPLLLFDEPLFALSGVWAEAVRERLAQLVEGGATMVIVTHYLPLARAVADRVTLVVDGEEIESGSTEDFFTRAQHPRTREYIEWGG